MRAKKWRFCILGVVLGRGNRYVLSHMRRSTLILLITLVCPSYALAINPFSWCWNYIVGPIAYQPKEKPQTTLEFTESSGFWRDGVANFPDGRKLRFRICYNPFFADEQISPRNRQVTIHVYPKTGESGIEVYASGFEMVEGMNFDEYLQDVARRFFSNDSPDFEIAAPL